MTSEDSEDLSNVEAETTFEVRLYIYDLSKGLAKALSSVFLGKQLPGIWHTSIVSYGREYFFGSMGIESCGAGETILGDPDQILTLGVTELPYSLFLEYIFALGESSYKPQTYDLFKHNCNNFTQEVAIFLTGKSIPKEILELPDEILGTPLGSALQNYFSTLSLRSEASRGLSFSGVGPPAGSVPFEPPSRRPPESGRERVREEPRRAPEMSSERPSDAAEERERPQERGDSEGSPERPSPVRKTRKYPDPPVVYADVDGVAALKELQESLKDRLNDSEQTALREVNEYLMTENGAWALGAPQLELVGKLFTDSSFPVSARLQLLRVLQAMALKEDVILFLHQDRQSHCIMSYIYRIESLSQEEQDLIIGLLCNLCSNTSSFDWLLYISEWTEDGQPCNNSRVTVRAAVHGLLCDRPPVQEKSAALMFNLSLKELFDDVATELSTAVLQYLHGDIAEEQAFYVLTALLRFLLISYNDVPALIKMLGPDLQKFADKSDRVKKTVEEIQFKMSVSISA